jgi:hypothetical protein
LAKAQNNPSNATAANSEINISIAGRQVTQNGMSSSKVAGRCQTTKNSMFLGKRDTSITNEGPGNNQEWGRESVNFFSPGTFNKKSQVQINAYKESEDDEVGTVNRMLGRT